MPGLDHKVASSQTVVSFNASSHLLLAATCRVTCMSLGLRLFDLLAEVCAITLAGLYSHESLPSDCLSPGLCVLCWVLQSCCLVFTLSSLYLRLPLEQEHFRRPVCLCKLLREFNAIASLDLYSFESLSSDCLLLGLCVCASSCMNSVRLRRLVFTLSSLYRQTASC